MPPAPKIDKNVLAQDYGFALTFLNSNPELSKLFNQAVAQTWSTDKFIAEVRGTKWFAHTSDTAREWLLLRSSDPATAKQRQQARATSIQAEAAALGIHLDTAHLRNIRDQSLMFGLSDQQVRQMIAAQYKYSPTTTGAGLAGQTIAQLKQTAAAYAVPISDAAIHNWTSRIISGLGTPDDFKNYALDQAKSLFPTMAKALDAGQTVTDYADPYKQSAVQLLGINPDDFNLMDPKWREAIDKVDTTSGDRTVQSLADWQTQLRTDSRYGYDQTAQARQQSAQLIDALGQKMGF